MPFEVGLWRLGSGVRATAEPLETAAPEREDEIEALLCADLGLADSRWMLIGRQVPTQGGSVVDLLAVDEEGRLVVMAFERSRPPREVVAQLLEHGAWARTLGGARLAALFEAFLARHRPAEAGMSLAAAYTRHFGTPPPAAWNTGHRLVLLTSSLDPTTGRMVGYLAEEHEVGINALFFRTFRDGSHRYLSRAWLIEPDRPSPSAPPAVPPSRSTWNGYYYVSFGHGPERRWEDARRHGYVSGGGSLWHTRTLARLAPGDRIWVNVPRKGYVGTGRVLAPAAPISRFEVSDAEGRLRPVREIVSALPSADAAEENQEHFVRVEWVRTVPLEKAVREPGFFGNQHTAARPVSGRWHRTVERLRERFGLDPSEEVPPAGAAPGVDAAPAADAAPGADPAPGEQTCGGRPPGRGSRSGNLYTWKF